MERKREREEGMVGEENEEGMGRKTVKICPPPKNFPATLLMKMSTL